MEIFNLKPLFEDVQLQRIFPDGKTFVDCIPKKDLPEILNDYESEKAKNGFDLKQFILKNFELPLIPESDFKKNKNVTEHIESLWTALTRQPDTKKGSLLPLPHPYIVPGGRFREIYYWDSYFTMLGLQASGRADMVENMVNNFSHLIDTVGYIPNGNRSYYIGRSQPPFFSFMVTLLREKSGDKILNRFLPQLKKEYHFWMKSSEAMSENDTAIFHVVKMPGGELLNRYWDEHETPRPESYREDVELAHQSKQNEQTLYRHLRAGAASGWDYSSRWFADENSFDTIHATNIVPVDLNCLLFHLEKTIGEIYALNKYGKKSEAYFLLAEKRKQAILKYCWNKERHFYFDYDLAKGKQTSAFSLAASTPLFAGIATEEHAKETAKILKEKFLKPGGVVTTLQTTGQQWDAPNGWAPLQWMTIIGLENYGHHQLAAEIAKRWIQLNNDVFNRTGKLMEKYNVVDTHLEAGGGEYQGQDGFGWTNGVLLALIKKYGMPI